MNHANYQPTHPHLCKIWEKLDETARQERLNEAIRREKIVIKINKLVKSGLESERSAIELFFKDGHRSSFRRRNKRYQAFGLDGLFDWRAPINVPQMPSEVEHAICTLRRVAPQITISKIIEHVLKHHQYQMSPSTVRRVLHRMGLALPRGRVKGDTSCGESLLAFSGIKLIEGAVIETGYVEAMVQGIETHREEVIKQSPFLVDEIDTSDRDEYGRFLSEYNERNLRSLEDIIGPAFASVEDKRGDKDPLRYHLSRASQAILERKFLALLYHPLFSRSGRWNGLRATSAGRSLEELCGYPYMPSTLELFTRELKYLGVSNTLWEIHAHLWMQKTMHWGNSRQQAVMFIDDTNKPLWTKMFSQATAVSSVGRVMPGLELICFHSGHGVPLWMVTHSGRAPLVKLVPSLLDKLEGVCGGAQVGRIIVIDAEGNSIPFLKGLEQGNPARGWVTRLKPNLVEGKEIFNRTNFRSYRDGDRVRMGECDFNDPAGGTFRARVIEIERRSKGTITYLGASMLLDEREWKPQDIADLYFERWPKQEANFRAVNRAVGCKDVHGNGKQLVANISVVTKLDELEKKERRLDERAEKLSEQMKKQRESLNEKERELQEAQRELKKADKQISKQLKPGEVVTVKTSLLIEKHKIITENIKKKKAQLEKQKGKVDDIVVKSEKVETDLQGIEEKREELESRRQIFKHDVELDSLFSLFKYGLVFLATYVLKEYLGNARMEPTTFLERLATLPARQRLTPDLEIITFEYNERDADVMALLEEHRDAINARRLRMRSGRILRILVDPAPIPLRPPPEQRRVMPGDCFRRS